MAVINNLKFCPNEYGTVECSRPRLELRIRELEAQLAALSWTPISPDNLPRVGDEVWRDLGEDQGGVVVEDVDADMQATWTIEDYKLEYWSHRRPINAPERDKEQGK